MPLESWFLWGHPGSSGTALVPLGSRCSQQSLAGPWTAGKRHWQSRPGFAPSTQVHPRDTNRGRRSGAQNLPQRRTRGSSPSPHFHISTSRPPRGCPCCERPRWDPAGASAARARCRGAACPESPPLPHPIPGKVPAPPNSVPSAQPCPLTLLPLPGGLSWPRTPSPKPRQPLPGPGRPYLPPPGADRRS